MQVPAKQVLLLVALCAAASCTLGDEIKLKDGKKLSGVIVGYEDNMFRIKTDFGFVLVEKDKIASIVPTGAAAPEPSANPAKTTENKAAKELAKAAESAEEAINKPKISDA